MGYIYKIINDINDKVYIGQTRRTINQRWSVHKQMSKTHSNILYKAMRKYGIEHFSIIKIEECDNNLLNEREKYWIKYYNSYYNGYNMTFGGNDGLGRPSQYEDKVLELYSNNSNMTYEEIASKVGCHVSRVCRILQKYNVHRQANKSILQYDLNDNFIQSFDNASQAAKSLGKQKGGHTPILNVCKNKPGHYTAYGYKWKFKE